MEESKVNRNKVMKQALQRRQTSSLPSNFAHRMMQQVYLEDAKKRKKATRLNYTLLSMAIIIILTLAALLLAFYTNFSFKQILQPFQGIFQSNSNWGFYLYLFILISILLFIDYLVRKWYYKNKV